MSLTLGLHTGHEASAVLFQGTQVLAAISDERLTRIKNDGGRLTDVSISEVLRIAGLHRSDVERLALLHTFFPEEYVIRESVTKEFERRIVRWRRARAGSDRPQLLLDDFMLRLQGRGRTLDRHFLKHRFLATEGFGRADLGFYDHHESHAMAAAFYSGFEECAVITMDGVGDRNICHTSGIWTGGRYQRMDVTDKPAASPGLFYSHITRLLGFQPLRHEGKVVGLAAMGDPVPLRGAFRRALDLSTEKDEFTSEFITAENAEARRYDYLKRTVEGHSRENVSAACQQVLEDVVLELVQSFLRKTGMRSIALNGGVVANVKLNQRIAMLPEVDRVFVFPAMSDTGNPVGAILLDHVNQMNNAGIACRGEALRDVYWGPEYSDEEICEALARAGVKAERLDEESLIGRAASSIHAGRIVGWFQGRMEFGPRALGNRSMLARPTEGKINDWLNQRLDRSEFMPFAPSVLAEHADEVFIGVDKARHTAEFMTITFDVRPEWRARIPAVVHVDGTARPQLVRAETNSRYHQLISAYHRMSGIPLVLNTSFNVHEEPIVCKPDEAIRAFVDRRVDCLGVGNFWVEHP